MRTDPKADKQYMRWAVDHFRCAVSNEECCKRRTFALLTHSNVPAKGSGVVLCLVHKQGVTGASLVSVGRQAFERLHDINLVKVAWWMQMVHDEEMLFGAPPKGVHSA